MAESVIYQLKENLQAARNELNKLRQQVRGLQQKQRKDIESITSLLKGYRCEGCRHHKNGEITLALNEDSNEQQQQHQQHNVDSFNSIGIIRTSFPEKRAVPRQANMGSHLRGIIELHGDLFTNPAHALQGLEDYSHLWILYEFHRNVAHPKAKIAPPRLGGERIGVFATRSPHRPCPIGLSLVEIQKIEGSTISFFGIDMVDGTPLLDIKPYIPFYDAPRSLEPSGHMSTGSRSENSVDFYGSRQEPDGEESAMEVLGATALTQTSNCATPPPVVVKVPAWVQASSRLHVDFNDRAAIQLQQLHVQKQCIIDVLEADPRSVYLRTKYNSQIFTFQLGEVQVTCKFDDKNSNVTVLQIRPTEYVSGNELPTQVTQMVKQ